MVWKNGKFGHNTGNTQRCTPILTYGKNNNGSIRLLGDGGSQEDIIDKLEQSMNNATHFDSFTREVLLQRVENLLSLFSSNQEYSIKKQNRWEFIDLIQTELQDLKSYEEDIQANIGGENNRYSYNDKFNVGPTDLTISLVIESIVGENISKISFSTIKPVNFNHDEEAKWIPNHNHHNRGVQRKDQLGSLLEPTGRDDYEHIHGSCYNIEFKVISGDYLPKQYSVKPVDRPEDQNTNAGGSHKKEKGQKNKLDYHWIGVTADEIDDIMHEELAHERRRRKVFAHQVRRWHYTAEQEAQRMEVAAHRERKMQAKRDAKKEKRDAKQVRKAARKEAGLTGVEAGDDSSGSKVKVAVPLWQFIHQNGNADDSVRVQVISCENDACSKSVTYDNGLFTPRPPAEKPKQAKSKKPLVPHPPSSPPPLKLPPTKRESVCSAKDVKITIDEKQKKKNGPSQKQRRKLKRKRELDAKSDKTSNLESSQKVDEVSENKDNSSTIQEQGKGKGDYNENRKTDGKPVFVKVKTSSLQSATLRKVYGGGYDVSMTSPRKFALDLSSWVHDFLADFVDFGMEPFAEPSLAVVCEVPEEEEETEDQTRNERNFSIIWLYIKSELVADGQLLLEKEVESRVKADLVYGMSKLTNIVVQAFKQLPAKCFEGGLVSCLTTPCEEATEAHRARHDWLYALCDWDISVYTAAQTYTTFNKQMRRPLSRCSTPRLPSPPSNPSTTPGQPGGDSSVSYRSSSGKRYQACNVCLVVLSVQKPLTDVVVMVTCGHVICTDCLHKNVIDQLERKVVPIKCPALYCSVELERGVLLYELSMLQYKQYLRHQHDVLIQQHPQWKWCPNQQCQRAAKLSGKAILQSAVTVTCMCGQDWCFHCYHGNHWPATCQQAQQYNTQRKNSQNESKSEAPAMLTKVVCKRCASRQTTSSRAPPGECKCYYQLCLRCQDVPQQLKDVTLLDAKGHMSASLVASALTPKLYMSRACYHGNKRTTWNRSLAQLNTDSLVKLIQRNGAAHRSHTAVIVSNDNKGQQGSSSQPHPMKMLENAQKRSSLSQPMKMLLNGQKKPSLPQPMKMLVNGRKRPSFPQPMKALENGHVMSSVPQPIKALENGHVITSVPQPMKALENVMSSMPQPMKAITRGHQQGSQLVPTMQMERLFLSLAHSFLLEVHTLLEYVYVVLMFGDSSDSLLHLVLKLETTATQIKQVLYEPRVIPAAIIPRLQHLHGNGKSIMAAIAKHFDVPSNGLSVIISPREEQSPHNSTRKAQWIGYSKTVLPSIQSTKDKQ